MAPLTFQSDQIIASAVDFLWPFFRIAAMFSVAPVLGSRLVSLRVRIATAALLTLMLVPVLGPMPAINPLSAPGVLTIAHQIVIGIAMGFILQFVLTAATMAGEQIAMTMGLGFAQINDPQNGVPVPIVSQFLLVTVTLIFLALDGHLALIALLANSFVLLPIGTTGLPTEGVWALLLWAGEMFKAAVVLALPAVTALLAVNLALGVMTRAAPQLNIFSVGFPITILGGIAAILVTLPLLPGGFEQLLAATLARTNDVLLGP